MPRVLLWPAPSAHTPAPPYRMDTRDCVYYSKVFDEYLWQNFKVIYSFIVGYILACLLCKYTSDHYLLCSLNIRTQLNYTLYKTHQGLPIDWVSVPSSTMTWTLKLSLICKLLMHMCDSREVPHVNIVRKLRHSCEDVNFVSSIYSNTLKQFNFIVDYCLSLHIMYKHSQTHSERFL